MAMISRFYLVLKGSSLLDDRYMITHKTKVPGESEIVGYVYGYHRASRVVEFLKES